MELEAHQLPHWPLGTYACHVRCTQDMELGVRSRSPQHVVSPSSPSPSRYPPPREGPRSIDGSFRGSSGMNRSVATTPDMRSDPKPWPSSSKLHDLPQKEETRSKAGVVCKRVEEGLTEAMLPKHLFFSEEHPEPPVASPRQTKRIRTSDDVDGPGTASLPCKKRRLLLHLVTSRLSRPFSLPATHILIRESGDNMPVLHRIQQLAALGARRRCGGGGGGGGSGGHYQGGLLVRKAAILNRVRIGVRQAAVSRGHTIMADLARRGNALDHGLLLVTTPAPATFPVAADVPVAPQQGRGVVVPPVWRPHTTSFHPPIDPGANQYYVQHNQHNQHQQQQQNSYGRSGDTMSRSCAANTNQGGETYDNNNNNAPQIRAANYTHTKYRRETTPEQPARCSPSRQQQQPYISLPCHIQPTPSPADTTTTASDEEDNTAFPAASFHDRYADLSDDDMDDVYADFGVLFGSGARSPDRVAGSSPVEEQFYEEYLDELDGIPWVV
ncbi:hypothetical protein F5Y07DRAFT_398274 [Xylaria sp. FL0933]|nr:hypothetical protein F5Y07DRAFT_398274 [Xylaria sp. FL0933]